MNVYSKTDLCSFIRDSFSRHKIDRMAFCKKSGLDPAHLSRILCGKCNPTLKTLFDILYYLEGHVWLSIHDDSLEEDSYPYYGLVDDALHAEGVSLDFTTD